MRKLPKNTKISLILWCLVLVPFFLYFFWQSINIPKMVEYGNATKTGFRIYCIAYGASLILAAVALAKNIKLLNIARKEKEATGVAPKGYKTLELLLIIGPIATAILLLVGFFIGISMSLGSGL